MATETASRTEDSTADSSEESDSVEFYNPVAEFRTDLSFHGDCSSSPIPVIHLADLEIPDEDCFCSRQAEVSPWEYEDSITPARNADNNNRQKHGKHKRHKEKHYMLPTKAWGVSRLHKSTESDVYEFQHYSDYRQYMEEYRSRHGYSVKATTPEKSKLLENGLENTDPYFQKICPKTPQEESVPVETAPRDSLSKSSDSEKLSNSAPPPSSLTEAQLTQADNENLEKQKPRKDDKPTSPRKAQNTTEKPTHKAPFTPESNSSGSDSQSKGNSGSILSSGEVNTKSNRRSVLPKLTPRRGEPGVRLAPETIGIRPPADSEESKRGAGNLMVASYAPTDLRENKYLPTPSNPLEEFREQARSQKRQSFGLKSVHSVDILSVIKRYAAKARELYPQLAATGPGIDPKPITVRTLGQPVQRQLPRLDVKAMLSKEVDQQKDTSVRLGGSSEGTKPRFRPPTPIPSLLLQALTNPDQYEQCMARLKQAEDFMRPHLPSSDSEDNQSNSTTRSDSYKWELAELRKTFKRKEKNVPSLSKSDPTGDSLRNNNVHMSKTYGNPKYSFSSTEGVFKCKDTFKGRKDPKKLDITGFPYRTREQHEAFYARLKKYKTQDG